MNDCKVNLKYHASSLKQEGFYCLAHLHQGCTKGLTNVQIYTPRYNSGLSGRKGRTECVCLSGCAEWLLYHKPWSTFQLCVGGIAFVQSKIQKRCNGCHVLRAEGACHISWHQGRSRMKLMAQYN